MFKITTVFIIFMLIISAASAQTLDTVSMGASYGQQVWYKLETDKETKSPMNNWDLAFSTRIQRDAAIWINPNANLYKAVAPVSAWASVQIDTNNLTPDKQQFNSDMEWYTGAFNATGDNLFNYGWGIYNLFTHNVVGDSIYVLKTSTGAWKKIMIEKLAYDTSYHFKYADLNGANEKSFELKKKNFAGKYFGYFSFTTNNQLDRDPLSKDWDLVFWRYIGLTPDQNGTLQNYPLTGVLSSEDVKIAKVKGDYERADMKNLTYKTQINTIGADWKSFSPQTNRWAITDSTAYFVKTANGKIFRLVFTGFGGSANGNCIFTKTEMRTASIKNPHDGVAALAVYPNPVRDGNITLVYELGKNNDRTQQVDIQLFNLAGQSVLSQKTQNTEGVQQLTLPPLGLQAGIYFARVSWQGKSLVQKILVQ